MKWDALWHAMWNHNDGTETWDRVSQVRAMRILVELEGGAK